MSQEGEGTAMCDKSMRMAEAVREACVEAAREAYERAGISGLCGEGRWELALDAIRHVEVQRILIAVMSEECLNRSA
jgi:hypothetical protein